MGLRKAIYEHLITKPKYNKATMTIEVLRDELQRKSVELNTERLIHKKEKEIWETKLKEQEKEIIELKKRKSKNVGADKK